MEDDISDYDRKILELQDKDKETIETIQGLVQTTLYEKEDIIKNLLKEIERMKEILKEKDDKINQLKTMISEALDKI